MRINPLVCIYFVINSFVFAPTGGREANLLLPNSSRRKCCSEFFCFIYQYSNALFDLRLLLVNIDHAGSLLLHSKIFFHIAALGLKCEAGCKITSDVSDSERACDGMKSGVFTCDRFLDRCMTTKVRISGPFRGFSSDMEIKNCSNSFVCEPTSDFNCK